MNKFVLFLLRFLKYKSQVLRPEQARGQLPFEAHDKDDLIDDLEIEID